MVKQVFRPNDFFKFLRRNLPSNYFVQRYYRKGEPSWTNPTNLYIIKTTTKTKSSLFGLIVDSHEEVAEIRKLRGFEFHYEREDNPNHGDIHVFILDKNSKKMLLELLKRFEKEFEQYELEVTYEDRAKEG